MGTRPPFPRNGGRYPNEGVHALRVSVPCWCFQPGCGVGLCDVPATRSSHRKGEMLVSQRKLPEPSSPEHRVLQGLSHVPNFVDWGKNGTARYSRDHIFITSLGPLGDNEQCEAESNLA